MAEKKQQSKLKQRARTRRSKKSEKNSKRTGSKSAPKDQVKQLTKQVKDLKQKNDDLDDKYLRAEAEMQNVQRHAAQDQQQILKYDGQKLAKSILPGLDNLKRALATKTTSKDGQQLKQGVKMVYQRLTKALADNNVKPVSVLGKKFDPEYAEAVQTAKADQKHPAGQVVKVLQKGYQIHDRILRPAMVIVAK